MKKAHIGIALSGGGARGIAHIGVLKALKEHDLYPRIASGASAGAIIGAMFAADKSIEEMLDFVKNGSLKKVFKLGLPFDGLASLENFKKHLGAFVGIETFEELKFPLFISASNLPTGEPEIFSSGPLLDVIMASSSVPLIFKPVEIDGQLYVDGGVVLNMPVAPIVPYCDFIIGSNVRPRVPISKSEVQSVFGIAERIFDLSLQGNIKPSEVLCDVVIAPPELHQYALFNIGKWQEIFEIGYKAGLEVIPEIQAKIRELGTG